jgi:hypothetical protein
MMSGTAEGTGGHHSHGSGPGSMSGAFDLLKQATQRMMSKDSSRYVTQFCIVCPFYLSLPITVLQLPMYPTMPVSTVVGSAIVGLRACHVLITFRPCHRP